MYEWGSKLPFLVSFWELDCLIFGISLLYTRSMEECLCVGSMGDGREGSGCDDDTTSALAGHLKGRRSSAVTAEVAGAAATSCANSHRWFGITQHSCSFEYLLTRRQRASRTYIKKNVPANYCALPATYRSSSLCDVFTPQIIPAKV